MAKFTFKQFQAEYPNDEACLAKLMEVNYGGTEIVCPGCGTDSTFHAMHTRKAYACQNCGYHIWPCAGTIFHKSKTNLTKWFFAMYLMTSTRHGVAAKELQRQLGVTYKCAWRMAHELRKLMTAADHGGSLTGHVEVDETWVGGANRKGGKGQGKRRSKKTLVMGMVERDGKLRAGPVPDDTKFTMEPIILENVKWGTTITTDGHQSYTDLRITYPHSVVNHAAGEYAVGIHHTNTIEGFWSQLKRSIKGTHVHVSSKHAWKYIGEFTYRRNYRESHSAMFDRLVSAFGLPRLQES
jgi:transposase